MMVETLIERLRDADINSQQRVLGSRIFGEAADRIEAAEAREARLSEALRGATASLVAAVSLLKRGSKKAAPSDKMFDQMILDYEKSIEEARAALSGSGSGWQNPLEHDVEFVAKMAWRTDPPNANNKLTDTERLSAIKYHPTIKGYAKPHIELAEREAASPSTAGER